MRLLMAEWVVFAMLGFWAALQAWVLFRAGESPLFPPRDSSSHR